MKNSKQITGLVIGLVALMAPSALAWGSPSHQCSSYAKDSDEIDAKATIVCPVRIEGVRDLNFGLLGSRCQDGTVQIPGIEFGGEHPVFTSVANIPSSRTSGQFNLCGAAGATVQLDLEDSNICLEKIGNHVLGGPSQCKMDLAVEMLHNQLVLDQEGQGKIYIGGTLNVKKNQCAGEYRGEIEVCAQYI